MWAYVRPYKRTYFFGLFGIAAANLVVNVGLSRAMMDLIRGVLALEARTLAWSVSGMTLVTLATCALVFLAGKALVGCAVRAIDALRKDLFAHSLAIPVSAIEARHSGDLLSRITADSRVAGNVFIAAFQQLASLGLTSIGCAVYLLSLEWRIGLTGIAVSIVPLLANLPFASPMHKVGLRVQESKASLTSSLSDLLQGSSVIRHYTLSGVVVPLVVKCSDAAREAGMSKVRVEAARAVLDKVAMLANFSFAVYVSYRAVLDQRLIPIVIVSGQLTSPIRYLFSNLGQLLTDIQVNLAAAQRALEMRDIPAEPERYSRKVGISDGRTPAHLGPFPALALEEISFRYGGSRDDVLEGISFGAGKGSRVALVGPSGGGKSTLFKLILGLYPPASGNLWAMGHSIFDTPLEEWRGIFSYVPQDAFLFAGTVYDNILGGMEDPGSQKVEEAARLANAHDFVRELPGGYQGLVSEKGSNLSGGQKQRIAIARAVLRDAPILLLDEATSALDAESEALVQEALERLMGGRTTVVIAHRLSTVRNADEILYLENGKIAERGTHEQLVSTPGGRYRGLVDRGALREHK
jgi:ATP-binding cassette subfamily B protein